MITLFNVGKAAEALQYFSKDNYYTEHEGLDESEWFGRGAHALGLAGKIDKQDFFRLLNGTVDGNDLGRYTRDTDTGELERMHRPGTDMTFSAPKSVSLLAEVHGALEVREAHEQSVRVALGYLERELSRTRQMVDGEVREVQTGNLVVSMFRHNTSRELDPQTHTHAIILNATQREDGAWRSLTNDAIYKGQRLIGAIYTAELASRLQTLGYELERSDDRGNFEVAGISRDQVEKFSQRRAEMAVALHARGIDIASATPQQKEDAALATRTKKTRVDHRVLLSQWKQRAEHEGIDFDTIDQRAAAAREAGGIVRADRLTGRQALEFAAAHLIEREAVIEKNELLRTAIEHGSGRVAPLEVEQAFTVLVEQGHLIRLPDDRYTTGKMLASEEWTLDQVRDTKRQADRILGPPAILERLAGIEQRQQFEFAPGQRDAIVLALSSHDRFVAVQGLSGAGKTTMLRGMRELAEEAGYRVRGMAPTGAAAKVLATETGIASDTVSMFTIKERQLQKDIEFAQQFEPHFKRRKELWVVDESSFLSQRQKAQLDHMAGRSGAKVVYTGDSLQLQGVEAGKPFEMAQRNGIETAYMTDINRQKTDPLVAMVGVITGKDVLPPGQRLTKVELVHNARAFELIDQAGMVKEFPVDRVLPELVGSVVALSAAERERTLVITAYNKDRKEINELVRAGLQARGELATRQETREVYESKGWTRAMISEAQYYHPGDVVRFGRDYKSIAAAKGEYMRVAAVDAARGVVVLRKGDRTSIDWEPKKYKNVEVYDADERMLAVGDLIRITRTSGQIKNGEVARVVQVDGDLASLALRRDGSGDRLEFDLEGNKHWDHAYATTVHGAQGATQYRTLFHIRVPESDTEQKLQVALDNMVKVFGDRSFYVGATRASHEMGIFTNNKGITQRAIAGKQDKSSAVETIQNARDAGEKNKTADITR